VIPDALSARVAARVAGLAPAMVDGYKSQAR